MNRRLEEELLQTAFGEASPEEMAELERRVMSDPEAAKALRTYQFMKEGLRDLGDIPEHQMSTDRLRHAILEQGLKPTKESSPWFGWLAIATPAAAAIALAFVLMNKPNTSAPMFVDNKPDMARNSDAIPSGDVEINRKTPAPSETVATNTNGSGTTVPAVEENRSPSFVRNTTHSVVYRNKPGRGKRTDPDLVVRVSTVAYGPPAPEMAEPSFDGIDATAGRGDKRKDDIIVIQPEKDAVTGANKATEVGSASNVAIGG